jgi:DNA-binding CsgD family transcriptional regulator
MAPSPFELAPRVRQVLRCLLEGDGDKQIARRLGISPYTVNQYTKVIYRHFRVASRAELLALWIRRGYPKGFAWASEGTVEGKKGIP